MARQFCCRDMCQVLQRKHLKTSAIPHQLRAGRFISGHVIALNCGRIPYQYVHCCFSACDCRWLSTYGFVFHISNVCIYYFTAPLQKKIKMDFVIFFGKVPRYMWDTLSNSESVHLLETKFFHAWTALPRLFYASQIRCNSGGHSLSRFFFHIRKMNISYNFHGCHLSAPLIFPGV